MPPGVPMCGQDESPGFRAQPGCEPVCHFTKDLIVPPACPSLSLADWAALLTRSCCRELMVESRGKKGNSAWCVSARAITHDPTDRAPHTTPSFLGLWRLEVGAVGRGEGPPPGLWTAAFPLCPRDRRVGVFLG